MSERDYEERHQQRVAELEARIEAVRETTEAIDFWLWTQELMEDA